MKIIIVALLLIFLMGCAATGEAINYCRYGPVISSEIVKGSLAYEMILNLGPGDQTL